MGACGHSGVVEWAVRMQKILQGCCWRARSLAALPSDLEQEGADQQNQGNVGPGRLLVATLRTTTGHDAGTDSAS